MDDLAIRIRDLSVSYGNTTAISNIDLDVDRGEYLGIIGPNGGGKSTLLKCILGLVKYDSGTIEIFGEDKDLKIGYVPQFSNLDKKFPITLMEVVLTGMIKKTITPLFKYKQHDKDKAHGLLEEVGIAHLANRQISQVSGGEFQKMLIARALAVDPTLLLLDEPTASVDAKSRRQIYELLSSLNKKITIVLVTHDLMAISSEVHSIACLNNNLVYHGTPELNENILEQLYGCPVDLIAHGVPHRVLKHHNGGHVC